MDRQFELVLMLRGIAILNCNCVQVIRHHQLAVGLFDLVLRGAAGYAKNLIVVALACRDGDLFFTLLHGGKQLEREIFMRRRAKITSPRCAESWILGAVLSAIARAELWAGCVSHLRSRPGWYDARES